MARSNLDIRFYSQIIELLNAARQNVVRAVNQTMVVTYHEIGRMIVEEEQSGKERADYGRELLKGLSARLTKEFGRGYSVDNLENMRRLYLTYKKSETLSRISSESKSETPSRKLKSAFQLSWSHYLILMRIDHDEERQFYEIEASKNHWSVRELQRQFDSELYTRLVLSRNTKKVKELSEKGLVIEQPKDVIKDPYILEFLGFPELSSYSETELEDQIISKLEHFLLELGNGFTFVGRQVRFTFDEEHFRVDLVFYNRILKCFVLIDLKIGKLRHQDLGQMQMYVNYYDRFVKLDDENKTVGIILCKDKKDTMVEITLPENNKQIFASKYKLVLPSKAALKKVIE
ncbi:PDDEXK nuclease domain-containing protein [Lunatimonas salinarum]|uniref:PDDEXK nuclease domain-containing protein n=1 Tax=Lunatimonas salinarum TaxID=1774590 RepID=UPI001ADF4F54|nr:PDDEXK nuclease domain-containing protein [Lunatimonas salinarum]